MVKRQKEKQYQSGREHRQNAQLRSGSGLTGGVVQRILPFQCCALTLVPYTQPVCNAQGILFDSVALMEFVMKHKKDPVTGEPLTTRDVVSLRMDKDDENRWQCPVLTKPFADHTKIVAIVDRTSSKNNNVEAYVYSFEAYKELNVKAKNWFDLTTGKKFSPKRDVLILNDPQNEDFQKQRDIRGFWHIQNSRSLDQKKQQLNVHHSVTATRIMEKLKQDKKKRPTPGSTSNDTEHNCGSDQPLKKLKIYSDDVTNVQYTSGKASGSFTSTAMDVRNENTTREATQEEVLQAQFQVMRAQKEKGYVRMITSMGDLLLELHCDIAPRTCTNFLGLCQAKKYDGTAFHRSISSFMIQGGQRLSGEGNKDDMSLWGGTFADEFDDRLKHDQRGVLSSANGGPNTNKRQFFITFKATPHLDRKHSVFGQVVDGKKVLKEMEKAATDKKDRPVDPIKIVTTEVLVDPAKEAEDKEFSRLQGLREGRMEAERQKQARSLGKTALPLDRRGGSIESRNNTATIGKYLSQTMIQSTDVSADIDVIIPSAPSASKMKENKVKTNTQFGNFSSW
ncbi:unnamed protein product [Cylindrotheca closterium]|uniref:RING-type E3 ubiquitin transferase n=1 Tax=Cylindrotheca closterium TaxID=2856 RepID=A0AAD2GB59_9STRA|nr:unnamed protein product [Cylindrotheca closterium]